MYCREWRESNQSPQTQRDSPVLLVRDVNHGQVASGDLPDTVVEHDVDSDVDLDEAHDRYAKTAVAFIVTATTTRHLFPEDAVASQNEAMGVSFVIQFNYYIDIISHIKFAFRWQRHTPALFSNH